MNSLMRALKSPSNYVFVVSALIGGLNAVQPLIHASKTASVIAVVLTVLGAVLAHFEKMTVPVEPPQTVVPPTQ